MTGWRAVIILTALMLVVLIGVNVRLWRRMNAAVRKGREAESQSPRD
ncbi:hypothetical protein ACLN6N_15965 [Sphingomonas carotinifaciens]|uniref:Heme exporter protein D n=1 Tax=Sphingomonas carotinifaciens TaxID=1166323 RepID=A0A1G7EY99_9SPHN|nr:MULTISPECIES: hypothetical protein [Sphingomonas]MBB4085801.1 hypothetical protein [Sphingomonas carotinifaciens]MWC45192.1 hypothetical protein [Sphingomonas carotinifaciens]SDE68631.1 hypothetical protein SAMN05216557_101154 [Sphingomonas carotinifaciens]